ncbi:hypothetical protein Hs30E_17780 [Lactococcus hodotermopsidis]|uniref:Phosphodiester glycosidase domain-containing protein n=1 Tax=Pseudolactococcus hodotermopsidis TaxID=2709157 RepID=A0A6A0BHF2_9LACT|nr:phosphodiester glycosidase family protein [Lactococcus hodotermopsidis]GFH43227.1 hypothetical protein Hs30E_17780 [Lactococcus hodotermopsidis]
MGSKHSKKSKFGLILFSLSLIIIAISSILIKKPIEKKAAVKPTISNSKKVALSVESSSSTSVVSSSSVSITESTEKVETTGGPGWVKVNSTGDGEKFTDLSTAHVTIYKAHNPYVLKTATSIMPTLQVLPEVMAQYPDALILNASGFNMDEGNITGFQINNGKLFIDWDENIRAKQAFVINKDGSITTYDNTTPAKQIIANGAEQSYSFGKILIKNGQDQNEGEAVNWMLHSFIGNDKDNNIYVMVSETGAGYDNIMSQIAPLNLENLVLMDGGGSSQMGLKGQVIVPSQDNRQVGDFIVLK